MSWNCRGFPRMIHFSLSGYFCDLLSKFLEMESKYRWRAGMGWFAAQCRWCASTVVSGGFRPLFLSWVQCHSRAFSATLHERRVWTEDQHHSGWEPGGGRRHWNGSSTRSSSDIGAMLHIRCDSISFIDLEPIFTGGEESVEQGFSIFFLPFTPCQLPNIKFTPCFLFTHQRCRKIYNSIIKFTPSWEPLL